MRHFFTIAGLALALAGCATSRSVEQTAEAPSADQLALMRAWHSRVTWGNKGMGVAAERAPGYIHVLTTAQPGFRPVASGPFVVPPSLVEHAAWQKYCSGQGGLSPSEWSIINASVAHCRVPDAFKDRCFPTGKPNACRTPGACDALSASATASAAPTDSFSSWRAWTRYCGGGRLTPADQVIVASSTPPAGFEDCPARR